MESKTSIDDHVLQLSIHARIEAMDDLEANALVALV